MSIISALSWRDLAAEKNKGAAKYRLENNIAFQLIFPLISPIYFCNYYQNIPQATLSKSRFCLAFTRVFIALAFFFPCSKSPEKLKVAILKLLLSFILRNEVYGTPCLLQISLLTPPGLFPEITIRTSSFSRSVRQGWVWPNTWSIPLASIPQLLQIYVTLANGADSHILLSILQARLVQCFVSCVPRIIAFILSEGLMAIWGCIEQKS